MTPKYTKIEKKLAKEEFKRRSNEIMRGKSSPLDLTDLYFKAFKGAGASGSF